MIKKSRNNLKLILLGIFLFVGLLPVWTIGFTVYYVYSMTGFFMHLPLVVRLIAWPIPIILLALIPSVIFACYVRRLQPSFHKVVLFLPIIYLLVPLTYVFGVSIIEGFLNTHSCYGTSSGIWLPYMLRVGLYLYPPLIVCINISLAIALKSWKYFLIFMLCALGVIGCVKFIVLPITESPDFQQTVFREWLQLKTFEGNKINCA